MSQDLFAAFGSPSAVSASVHQDVPLTAVSGLEGPAVHLEDHDRPNVPLAPETSKERTSDDDDFGDFEDASVTSPATASADAPLQPKKEARSIRTDQVQQRTYSPTRDYPPPRTYPPPKPNTPSQGSPAATVRNPFPPRPTRKDKDAGHHPFAGHMDLLFAADEDEYDAGADEIADLANNPEAAMAYSKRVIAEQHAVTGKESGAPGPYLREAKTEMRSPNRLRKKSGYIPATKTEVLFDAEDSVEDDSRGLAHAASDSGQEEVGNIEVAKMPDIDLLALDEDRADNRRTSPPLEGASSVQPSPPTTERTVGEDDDWDSFEDASVPEETASAATHTTTAASNPLSQPLTSHIFAKPVVSTNELPPTNVPPPSVLLSLFPTIFASAQDSLLAPLAKLDSKQRQILLAHPATHMFLRGYLNLMIVLASIIAGRKQRWKRDQFLAQSTRIGPAGGKGGMKLAGVDRSEVAKEDREVSDTVRLYRGHVGKLRSAVAAATGANMPPPSEGGDLPTMPEIAEQMPVKVLKAGEGGVTAPHACALCGLKRDERVAKVHGDVSDSFGEWWVDGMSMHLLCRNFWKEHKSKLKSR